MAKDFGNLSRPQFRQLVGKLPEFRGARDEFGGLLGTLSKEKLESFLTGGASWGPVYELTFSQYIVLVADLFGQRK